MPTITHRQELGRHELFQVWGTNGRVIGVKDCCPVCRSNLFVNATDGGYNIEKKSDPSRSGVRFIHTLQGNVVPIGRKMVCRSPTCPSNVKKMQV